MTDNRNFKLGPGSARLYMRIAREAQNNNGVVVSARSLREAERELRRSRREPKEAGGASR